MMKTDRYYLERAMQEAERAYKARTYPIGAIIVDPGGEIIGRGYNHVYSRGDFTSHAEMEAIRDAGSCLMKGPNFKGCWLYTTMEPCLMCCGAILMAQIQRVIWIIDDDLHGALRRLCNDTYPLSATPQKKEAEFSIPDSHFVSGVDGDEAIADCDTFQGGWLLSSLYTDKIASPSLLPAGYAARIASLSILPARENDLAQRMDAWMKNWNAAKEFVLSQWR